MLSGCNNLPSKTQNEIPINSYSGNGAEIQTREECEANNGIWKMWSYSDARDNKESCNIRADDYGISCSDSKDCEGLCLDTSCLEKNSAKNQART